MTHRTTAHLAQNHSGACNTQVLHFLVDQKDPFCYNIGIVINKEPKLAKLLITTQVYENYGAHDWDGTGECPQYWKAKGGNDYVIKNFKGGSEQATAAVMSAWNQVESATEYFRETIVGWNIVSDDYLTEFEQSQLEYEGRITYPAQELQFA